MMKIFKRKTPEQRYQELKLKLDIMEMVWKQMATLSDAQLNKRMKMRIKLAKLDADRKPKVEGNIVYLNTPGKGKAHGRMGFTKLPR